MTETTFVTSLMQQAPGMGAIIVVVILFLKAIEKRDLMTEKRDQLFIDQMNKIVERLAGLETIITSHDKWEREVIDGIQDDIKPKRRAKAK